MQKLSEYDNAPVAENGTNALLRFMEAITDIQSASIGFYSGILAVQRKVLKGQETTADLDIAEKIYNEMAFCRVIDIYQQYITEMIVAVFEKYPHSIFNKKYDISQIFDFSDIEDLKKHVIEREVSDLSYKSISELNSFLKEKIGLGIFRSRFEELKIQHFIYRRNAIVHNNGLISKTLCEKSGFPLEWIGKKFIIPDAHRVLRYFINSAKWLDSLYVDKFQL